MPLISSHDRYENCYWYEALTGNDCSEYYGWDYDFREVKGKLKKRKEKHFAVLIDSLVFQQNKDYFEKFEVVYKNEKSVVYHNKIKK